MKCLIIDTSTERAVVALTENNHVKVKKELPFGLNHSQALMHYIEESFEDSHWKLEEIDFIAIGAGPGSYTGLRVGASVAKTLSYSKQIPLIGISTLKLFIPLKEGSFSVLIDAKIGGVYIVNGESATGKIYYKTSPEMCSLDSLKNKIDKSQFLVTPNQKQLRVKINDLYPDLLGEWVETGVDAEHASRLALEAFDRKEYSRDGRLELEYLRRTQAEIERDSMRGDKDK